MKILTIGVGAFGMAILNHLSKTHNDQTFYAYEANKESLEFMKKNRENPYFFVGEKLSNNIELLDEIESILPSIDLIIIAIPNQFVKGLIENIKSYLKHGVSFLNLSKGIDNSNLKTVSDNLGEVLGDFEYNYNVLSGGMIENEVFYFKELGAQIGYSNKKIGEEIRDLFQTKTLEIELTPDYKNIELYGAFKNILALYNGYLEGRGFEYSTIGYYFCKMFKDIEKLILELGGENDFNFRQFALGGDIIATCFGNSRNRYLGKIVGTGENINVAIERLKKENKHAEGYETLKGVKEFIKGKNGYEELNKLIEIFL